MSTAGPARWWNVVGQTLDKKYYFVKRAPSKYSKNRVVKHTEGYVMAHLVDRDFSYFEVHSAATVARREA